MKKAILKITAMVIALSTVLFISSCSDDNDDPTPIVEEEFEVLEGGITSSVELDASKQYLLRGKVYVQSGATLTIPAGTKIYGEKDTDGTLIINRGGKIDAQGTADNPIVMTSQADPGFRNRGDWGGVVILGKAYTNGSASSTIEGISSTAGSEDGVYGPGNSAPADDDNSGIMRYVRIEFAGIALSQDNELNSLTMGAVGSGTQIDHIMVSYANDDAYEWFGGANNHKYLVAYSTLDDDFDTDRGYIGKVQHALVVRDPNQADFSGSRAWESSSNNTANVGDLPNHGGTARHSAPTFANVTVLGPRLFRAPGAINGFYQAALEINSSSSIKIYNSILTGFTTGVRWNNSGESAMVTNNVFAHHGASTAVSGSSTVPGDFATTNTEEADIQTIFGNYPSGSLYNFDAPPFFQAGASPYLTGAPAMSTIDPFFDDVDYYGAFGTAAGTEWNFNSGWIEWNPVDVAYEE
jgi:hypothetical protein